MFKSTYKEGEAINSEQGQNIEYSGKKYTIGGKGAFTVDINKISDKFTELATLTAAANTMKDDDYAELNIIAGLPVKYYSSQKDNLISAISKYGQKEITLNGTKKTIKILSVHSFPQSAGIVIMNPKEYKNIKTLVIDMGGYTIDVSLHGGENGLALLDYATYNKGIYTFYNELMQKMNANYSLGISDINDMEDIINTKEYFSVNGTKYKTSILDNDINFYLEPIISDIQIQFPIKSVDKVLIIGGAGKFFYPYIKKSFIKYAELYPRSQWANAEAFLKIGNEL